MENIFSKHDNVLFALAPKEWKHFYPTEFLAIIHELTEQAWQTPYSNRVDSLTNYQHTEAIDDDITSCQPGLVIHPALTTRSN